MSTHHSFARWSDFFNTRVVQNLDAALFLKRCRRVRDEIIGRDELREEIWNTACAVRNSRTLLDDRYVQPRIEPLCARRRRQTGRVTSDDENVLCRPHASHVLFTGFDPGIRIAFAPTLDQQMMFIEFGNLNPFEAGACTNASSSERVNAALSAVSTCGRIRGP